MLKSRFFFSHTKILLAFFLFTFSFSWAQQNKIDSLFSKLNANVSYREKANALYELSTTYQKTNPDSSYSYAKQLYALATEHKDQNGITKAETMSAFYLMNVGEVEEGLRLCEKNLALLENDSSDMLLLGKLHRLTGISLMKLNQQKEAVAHFYSAMKIGEKTKNDIEIVSSITNIGWAYMELYQYEKAIQEFVKAIRLASTAKKLPSNMLPTIYNNLASCYGTTGKIDSAYKYTSLAVDISLKINDYQNAANGLNILATVLIEKKNYDEALKKLLQAKKLRERIGDPFYIVSDMTQLANVYATIGNYKEGIKIANEALAFARENKLDAKLPLIYNVIAKNYEAANDYKQAALTYKQLSRLKDTLFAKDNAEALAQMQAQYETDKKEAEIKDLKQEQEINSLQLQKRNYILIALILLIALISTISIFYIRYQSNQRKLAIQETEEKERQRMAKDIHDDLGSGLSKIKFMSEVISSKSKNNPEILSSVKSISETSISLVDNMRDLIWALNPDNTQLDGLVARIREYSNDYLNDTDKKLILRVSENFPAQKINSQAHRNILFIAKEALQNVVKHANTDKVEIEINHNNELFNLKISDNGKGIPEEHKQGNGLRNMKQRAENIGAIFNINSSEKGTEIQLSIPLSKL